MLRLISVLLEQQSFSEVAVLKLYTYSSSRVAGLSVGYMSIPGHTHDSLVYKIGQIIFTGDTLTAGLIGETSSSYSHNTLLANINSKILSQQTDIILMPGHGPPSSVEAERHFNKSFAK